MKKAFETIAARNRVANRILDTIHERDSFLVVGHKRPDEDCVSSMVAFALMVNKFSKTVTILLEDRVNENFEYLLRICTYNAISVVYTYPERPVDTLVILDTAKPDLRITDPGLDRLLSDPGVRVIEVDHHLGTDSDYHASVELALVDRATSAAELVGVLAYKLTQRSDLLEEHDIREIFSRNIVLAIVTGIIGDTKLGSFLQTSRERRMYRAWTEVFGVLLEQKTVDRSGNFSSVQQVFDELERLSEDERACYEQLWAKRSTVGKVAELLLSDDAVTVLTEKFGWDTVNTVLRAIADELAEESGYLSLVGFAGNQEKAALFQFRARRSKSFTAVDLRDLIDKLGVTNGGGHQGAIGFRVERSAIADVGSYFATIVETMNQMIADS